MREEVERRRRRRRDRVYIIAELLKIAKRGALKTQLMYGANLSFAQLSDYLSFLISIGLLRTLQEGNKVIYKTTSEGFEFLANYDRIISLLGE